MVKVLLCDTRDAGLTPGRGTKIPYAAEQLNLSTATTAHVHHKERPHMMQ